MKAHFTFILFIALCTLITGCAMTKSSAELSDATLEDIKANCIRADASLPDHITTDDIVVERMISGFFHDANYTEKLVVFTLTREATEALHHLDGYRHYYFIVMDAALQATNGEIFSFVADEASYMIWKPKEDSRNYLFISGIEIAAGPETFIGGIYNITDWSTVWAPKGEDEWPVAIGEKIYVVDQELNLEILPYIDENFERSISRAEVPVHTLK